MDSGIDKMGKISFSATAVLNTAVINIIIKID